MNRPVRILFVNAIDWTKKVQTVYPPLGIGYLMSSLRETFGSWGVECRMTDCSERDLAAQIREWRPDIVGISSVSQNYLRAMLYAQIAKLCNVHTVVGGVHISMLPSSLTEYMDVGVIGEGEVTICALVDLFERTGGFAPADLHDIDGLVFRMNGRLVQTPPREPFEPLDDLPFPDRSQTNIGEQTYMFTSRGCPYRCSFCASSRFWGKVRRFSPEYVAREIEDITTSHGVREIFLYDDIFVSDAGQVRALTRELYERGLLGAVSFACHIRANMVTEETLEALRELGVHKIGMGLESASPRSLRYLKGGSVTVEDNDRAVRLAKRLGFHISASFIIGSPQETREDALETYRFARRHKLFGFVVNVLTPYPGTPVWDHAHSRGLVSDSMDWSRLSIDFEDDPESAIILSETMTRREVWKLVRQFRREQRRLARRDLVLKGVKHPLAVPGYLWRGVASRA